MQRLAGPDPQGSLGRVPTVGAKRAGAGRRAVQERGGRVFKEEVWLARSLRLAHGRLHRLRLL